MQELIHDLWQVQPPYPQYPPPSVPPTAPGPHTGLSFLGRTILYVSIGLPTAVGVVYALIHVPRSLRFVWRNAKPRSLLQEGGGIDGCGFFCRVRKPELNVDWYHCLGKGARLLFAIAFAPLFVIPFDSAWNILKATWFQEQARPYTAILAAAPGGDGAARFHPTGYTPSFIVRVRSRSGGSFDWQQIHFPTSQTVPYTAISYSFDGARTLCGLSSSTISNSSTPQQRKYTLGERRSVAIETLKNYILTLRPPSSNPRASPWEEYIWIDELCLSEGPRVDHSEEHSRIRDTELGRLADIFSRAANVVVFCNKEECNHTSLDCHWNKRLFTIPEIFGAYDVTLMIKSQSGGFRLDRQPGRQFRRNIQNEAEKNNKGLHFHAIMKSAPDPVDSQPMIHSLIVEAMRRDDLGAFVNHNMLGRGLNGLLARRARLEDVPGRDGWADLCWLLELNQGHFNAATLAAVCSLEAGSDRNTDVALCHPWLGRPVLPEPGTERLEPLVTAIPIANSLPSQPAASALNIVGPKIIGVAPFPRRDRYALYTHKELRGLLLLSAIAFLIGNFYHFNMIATRGASAWRLWFNFFTIGALKLVAETTCLVCDGWVYLDATTWGKDPSLKLGGLDCRLRQLVKWGDPSGQPVPRWHAPSNSTPASIVDLKNGVYTRVDLLRKPNAMLPLAVHGSGITCMLLNRPEDYTLGSERVGMVNLPPYILAQAKRAASVVIGGQVERGGQEGWMDKIRKMLKEMINFRNDGYTRIEDQATVTSSSASLVSVGNV